MAEDFGRAVEDGLKLSKRIYLGKDRPVAPPRRLPPMERSPQFYLPTAPMVYAVISDPAIVDNPDIPSYQPYVHGRCDPPVLIPLQMNSIQLEVDCYLDTAFVRVSGVWRVHCVMGSRSCDCRVAVPMGEQGSILGVEVDLLRKSYSTKLIPMEDDNTGKVARAEDGGYLKPQTFMLTIPQIDGGSNLSITLSWSQKLQYNNGEFTLCVPFSFPEYVTPAIKKLSKKERIQLSVNAGIGSEIICKANSHPLKENRRHVGQLGFLYEAEVLSWSNMDFCFSYNVSASHIFGNILLQSPAVYDVDQREMFCIYLLPGTKQYMKMLRKNCVFVVDISESMHGKPLEDAKAAVTSALSKLGPEDSFTIIAFNGEALLYSTSLESATKETVEKATEWINVNFIAGGSTNILNPLEQAIKMLSSTPDAVPIIFLVTDGAVENERHICDVLKKRLVDGDSLSPRIYTFGIGSFCNHYFLRMLAMIGRGQYDAALDLDSIELRMSKLFSTGLSTVFADVTTDALDTLDEVEVFSLNIPDLSLESPMIVSGRYKGKFPDSLKVRGVLGDSSIFETTLKVARVKDIPLDRVLARQHIDLLTAQAWCSENKQLEQKVAKMSMQTCNISEYTHMILLENDKTKKSTELSGSQKPLKKGDPDKVVDSRGPRTISLRSFTVGFGDLIATAENTRPGVAEPKLPEAAEVILKAASNCCGQMCNRCCCMCCIQCCTKMNNQCAIFLTQLCTALTCIGCFECCTLCCPGEDGH